jgi:hypothetical protein
MKLIILLCFYLAHSLVVQDDACNLTVPASYQVSIIRLNATRDKPSNWMFRPPGVTCGESFVDQDGTVSFFTLQSETCITSFSPSLAEFNESLAIHIEGIGQDIMVFRVPFTFNTSSPFLTHSFTHTLSSSTVTLSTSISQLERCTRLPVLIHGPLGETWRQIEIERTVCNSRARIRYSTTIPLKASAKNLTHHLYRYQYGGESSTCDLRSHCLSPRTLQFAIPLPPPPRVPPGHGTGIIITTVAVISPAVSTAILYTTFLH